jgi:hypothetical protein
VATIEISVILLPLRVCAGCRHPVMPGEQHVSYDSGQHLCWSCYRAGMEALVIEHERGEPAS